MVACLILGIVIGIAAVVCAYIFIIPEKRVKGMNKFLYILHNIFTFKSLLIEKINRFLYVLLTILSITVGFFMLFAEDMFPVGLLMMLILPILLRIVFEASMLKIIMTNNLIELNKKTSPKPAARPQRPAPRPAPRYEENSYNPYGE